MAAGGLASSADRDYVAKHLNLAQKLSDGAKIYIPKDGEVVNGASTTVLAEQAGGLININTASLDSLDSLSGIGQVTAQKIMNGRPYADIQELITKHIITQKVFDKIKSSITTL